MSLLNEIISSNKKQYKSSLRDYVMSKTVAEPKITRFTPDVPIDEQRLALIGKETVAKDVPPPGVFESFRNDFSIKPRNAQVPVSPIHLNGIVGQILETKSKFESTFGKEALRSWIRGLIGIPKTAATTIEKAAVTLQTKGVTSGRVRFERPESFGSTLINRLGKALETKAERAREYFTELQKPYQSEYMRNKDRLSFEMLKDPMFYTATIPETVASMVPAIITGRGAFKATQILGTKLKYTPEVIRRLSLLSASIAGGFVGENRKAHRLMKKHWQWANPRLRLQIAQI